MKLPPHQTEHNSASSWQQLVSGVQYTARHSELSALILLSLVFSVFGISYSTVLPAFVRNCSVGRIGLWLGKPGHWVRRSQLRRIFIGTSRE